MADLRDIDQQRLSSQSTEPTPMVRPDGALVLVENPDVALQSGYKHADESQIAEMQKAQAAKIAYSNSPIKAGLAGAARGATLGLSDLALTKTGLVNPETLKGLEEQNPTASTIGEIGGTIGSSLLAPEMSLPGLLERGATKLATSATQNIASRAAQRIASKALSDAAQGAVYGAGNLLSDATLGNKDLTAEQLVGTVGIGTILGGSVGAGLTGLGIAAQKTVNATKIPNMLQKAAGGAFGRISGWLSDKDPAEIEQLFRNRFKATISDEERQDVQNQIIAHIKSQDQALSDFSNATMAARPARNDSILSQEFPNLTWEQGNAMDAMAQSIQDTVKDMRDQPEIYTKVGTVRKLEILADRLEDEATAHKNTPANAYAYMNKVKQKLDELSKFETNIPDSDRDTVRAVRNLRAVLKNQLENQNVWGTTGQRQADFNKATNQFLTAQRNFYKQFAVKTFDDAGNVKYDIDDKKLRTYFYNLGQSEKKEKILGGYIAKGNAFLKEAAQVHADLGNAATVPNMNLPSDQMETLEANNLLRRLKSPYRNTGAKESMFSPQAAMNVGAPALMGHPVVAAGAAVFNALSNPVSTIEKIAALEHVKQKAVDLFNHHIDSLLDGKASDLATILAVDTAGRANLLSKEQSDQKSADIFKHRVSEIGMLAQNPDELSDRLAATTRGIEGSDELQGLTSEKLANAVAYLANTAPKNPFENSLTKKVWNPAPTDVMSWNRRLAAVQNPYAVLANPTREGIETLQAVYPQIYAEMQQKVMEKLAGKEDSEVPYKAKVQLSRIFGLDLDRSNPADVSRLQANYVQGTQQQQASGPAPRKRGIKKGQAVAEQSMNGSERIASKLT